MRRVIDIRNMLAAVLVAASIAVAAAPAHADDQRAMSPGQVYDYSCGRLGSDCGEKPRRESRSRDRRATMRSSGRAEIRCAGRRGGDEKRAARKTRRCGRGSRAYR